MLNLEALVIWIKQQTAWLYLQVYQNHMFFVDLWSLAHFWSGFVVVILLLVVRSKQPWLLLTVGLTLYEIVEILMLYVSLHVFNPETIKDQFTDIFVGILGGLFGYLFIFQKFRLKIAFFKILDFESVFVSMTYSFIWVGHSRFFFLQVEDADLYGLGLFFWRSLMFYCLLRIYGYLKGIYSNNFLYLFFSIVYTGFYILSGIISGSFLSQPAIDLQHTVQPPFLNVIYIVDLITFPLIAILSYELIGSMIDRAGAEFLKSYSVQVSAMEPVLEIGS